MSSTVRNHNGSYTFFLFPDALVAVQEVDKGWFQTKIERTFAYAIPLLGTEVLDLDQVNGWK